MKLRVLITSVIGYNLVQLQKRVFFFFWITIDELKPDEKFTAFVSRISNKYPGIDIPVKEQTLIHP